MAFTTKDWKDYPDTTTPITAAALEDLETRVSGYADNFLQLYTGTGKKIKWGTSSTSGFGGTNRKQHDITHGLGTTPTAAFAWAQYIGSASTSTGVNEPVICSLIDPLDGTYIKTLLSIANGATTSVGTTVHWVAIY